MGVAALMCANPSCSNPCPRPGRAGGRPFKYCSRACRTAASRLRSAADVRPGVRVLDRPPPAGAGVVAAAVRADIAELDGAAGITGLSAVAISLAESIDAHGATGASAKELGNLLDKIRRAGQQPTDELAAFLTSMAAPG